MNVDEIRKLYSKVTPPELQQQAASDFHSVMANSAKVEEAQIPPGADTAGGQGVLHNAFNIQRGLER